MAWLWTVRYMIISLSSSVHLAYVVISVTPQLTSLELQYVSPKLLMCADLELAVPGTYDPNQSIIRIQKAKSSLQVITSKQRPRKLSIFGELISTFLPDCRCVLGFHCIPQLWIHEGCLLTLEVQNVFNSLAPGRPGCHFKTAIFNLVLLIGFFRSSNDNALR